MTTKMTKADIAMTEAEAKAAIREDLSKILTQTVGMTDLYRSLATHKVALAANFQHKGRPDWTFQSADFRTVWNEVLKTSGFDKDSIYKAHGEEAAKIVNRVHSAIRYHVSDIVRQVAPKADRDALKLNTLSNREQKVGASREARTPEARISIPGMKLPEAAQSKAIDVARFMADTDVVGAVSAATDLVRTARTFSLPTDEDGRTALLMLLSTLTQEASLMVMALQSTTTSTEAPAETQEPATAAA